MPITGITHLLTRVHDVPEVERFVKVLAALYPIPTLETLTALMPEDINDHKTNTRLVRDFGIERIVADRDGTDTRVKITVTKRPRLVIQIRWHRVSKAFRAAWLELPHDGSMFGEACVVLAALDEATKKIITIGTPERDGFNSYFADCAAAKELYGPRRN